MDPEQRVTFTVKELLDAINKKLDGLIVAVADKVSRAEHEALMLRVSTLELERAKTRAIDENSTKLFTSRQKWVVLVFALIGALGTVISSTVLLSQFLH